MAALPYLSCLKQPKHEKHNTIYGDFHENHNTAVSGVFPDEVFTVPQALKWHMCHITLPCDKHSVLWLTDRLKTRLDK